LRLRSIEFAKQLKIKQIFNPPPQTAF
jgi:hypothetical protein